MASIIESGGGKITLKTIQFRLGDARPKIRLGRVSLDVARAFKANIEALVLCHEFGRDPTADLSSWVLRLDPELRGRLAEVGLIEPSDAREKTTLKQLLDAVFETLDVRASTRVTYQQTRSSLLSAFAADTPLSEITTLDAERWRTAMLDEGLAAATTSKRIKTARSFFRSAVKWAMIEKNPFDGVRAGSQANSDRMAFVPAAVVARVMEQMPDLEWRVLIALIRWGGLRSPSETMGLRWEDVRWEQKRLVVRSPKTSGKVGREYRLVPLFSEYANLLSELFTAAPAGAEFVFNRLRGMGANHTTQFKRFVARAGVEMWEKAFQNLRMSRATELREQFNSDIVCKWMGHTEVVARAHYVVLRDDDFERAAALPSALNKAVQNVVQGVPASKGQEESAGSGLHPNPRGTKHLTLPVPSCPSVTQTTNDPDGIRTLLGIAGNPGCLRWWGC